MRESPTLNRAKWIAKDAGIEVLYVSSHGSFIINPSGEMRNYNKPDEPNKMLTLVLH